MDEDNELNILVKDIPKDELELFCKKTNATTSVKEDVDYVKVDYSWVDNVNDAIPFLDNIIRNPRRFIVSEEDIVPIEKTKKVSEESIKHLATHTQLIQEVDDDGMVKPIKLLNVFKEETIDLYENRFIYSLINNLYVFLRNQLTYKEEALENKNEKTLNYKGNTNYNNAEIDINLSMVTKYKNEVKETEEEIKQRQDKINHIKEVLEDFKASKFMKMMNNATPVRSPIRKTNVILKDQNFIKAVSLWEFLESFQIRKPVVRVKKANDLIIPNIEKNLGLTYYINYALLTEANLNEGKNAAHLSSSLAATVLAYAKKFNIDENKLQEELINQIKIASKYKEEQIKGINNAYNTFIDGNFARFNKASLLFK
jgi:hypothetical protein